MSDRKLRVSLPLGQLALILMAVLVLYLAIDFGRQVVLSQRRQDELKQVEGKIKLASQKRDDLEKRLRYVQSPEAAQEWARQQGWVKANEVPVVLVAPSKPEATPVPAGTQRESDSASNRNRWLDMFFGGH